VTAWLSHWRLAGAAAVFVLTGSFAVGLAMHDEPSGAYQSPAVPPARRHPVAMHTAAERAGLALLVQAVSACRSTAYSGVQVFRSWGPAGTSVWLAEIWHRPGGQVVADPMADRDDGSHSAGAGAAAGAAAGTGAGGGGGGPAVPGPTVSVTISGPQLTLLETGYLLDYTGPGSADGRPAELVTVDRPDGTLAARYWLDRQTRLPLRRQLFDDHDRIVSDISFTGLRIGTGATASMPAAAQPPWGQQVGATAIAALRDQGWPLPAELPGDMALFAASQATTSTGQVIGVSYSDGLSVISLFVQRGQLPAHLAGWKRTAIAGHDVYAIDPDGQTIAWSGDGYVFTLLADAPAATVDQAIAALPRGGQPGFWGRLGRGFRRLATMANPFR
jgi:sigma-E factor negative regulatory protein RseB